MTTFDRDLMDAFVPEFEAAAIRLAMVREPAAAGRALDQLRAMAAALGAPSLMALMDRTAQALDPLDWPALHAGAEALARQAVAIGAAGADLPLAPPRVALLDSEMLAAFAPEFATACDRLAGAADAAAAGRALDGLRAMAGAEELGSLLHLLEPASGLLDPFDAAALPGLAAALAGHAAAIAASGHDLPPPAGRATARRRVLVVDDSAMMRRLVRETLALDPDFVVVGEAADGLLALEALRRLTPDLTMLDIEMPELDGLGVLRRWALEGGGAVVIVSSAARPGSPTAVAARRLGAAGIVGKPSGALSPDLRERQGAALLRTARRAAGLPVEALR